MASPQPSSVETSVFGAAIQGDREEQQDAFRIRWLVEAGGWLLVLADGMGGHASGAKASKIAVDGFVATCVSRLASGAALADAFDEALNDANDRIARFQEQDAGSRGMGATLVAAFLSRAGVSWISVGDSPLWICGKDGLRRLNADHSLRGLAESVSGSFGNMLQSAVNGLPIPLVDRHPECQPLGPGEQLLLCSDGVLTLSESEIATLVAGCGGEPKKSVERLLAEVERQNVRRQDNCSVIVARHEPAARRASRALVLSVVVAAIIAVVAYFYRAF